MRGQPKFCGNCGAPLGEGVNFCGACGHLIKESIPAPNSVDTKALDPGTDTGNTGRSNIFEIWRRVFLVLFFCGAVGLAFYAPLSPLFAISPVDFAEEQKKIAKGYLGYVSEEKKRLAGLPLERFIDEVTKGKVIPVEGEQWVTFYNQLTGTLKGTPPDRRWSRRADNYQDRLYFRSGEIPPLNVSGMSGEDGELYLKLNAAGQERYMRVRQVDTTDIFGFGTSRSDVASSVLYPYRRYSPWLALAGLALYLLPWPKKRPEVISYPRWRIILLDFVSLLVLVVFFSLPLFVIGGTVQAVTEYFFFTLIFWGFAAIGIWCLKISAWQSGLQFAILPDRLRRFTYRGQEDYPFAGMDYVQPVLQVPPRWLVWLSWLGAIGGRSPTLAGSALMLSGFECNGFRIVNRDGRTVNIWLTGLTDSERILEALKNAGVPLKKDVHRFEGMTVR